jgi:hypothetical protein
MKDCKTQKSQYNFINDDVSFPQYSHPQNENDIFLHNFMGVK